MSKDRGECSTLPPSAPRCSGRWHKVGYIVYTDSNGNVTARCHGHKVVAITDLASTRPLVWTNVPASMGERDACRLLLPKLFELCRPARCTAHPRRRQPL